MQTRKKPRFFTDITHGELRVTDDKLKPNDNVYSSEYINENNNKRRENARNTFWGILPFILQNDLIWNIIHHHNHHHKKHKKQGENISLKCTCDLATYWKTAEVFKDPHNETPTSFSRRHRTVKEIQTIRFITYWSLGVWMQVVVWQCDSVVSLTQAGIICSFSRIN